MATTVEQLQLLLTLDDQLSGRLQSAIEGLRSLEQAAGLVSKTLVGIGESAKTADRQVAESTRAAAEARRQEAASVVEAVKRADAERVASEKAAAATVAATWREAAALLNGYMEVESANLASHQRQMGELAKIGAGERTMAEKAAAATRAEIQAQERAMFAADEMRKTAAAKMEVAQRLADQRAINEFFAAQVAEQKAIDAARNEALREAHKALMEGDKALERQFLEFHKEFERLGVQATKEAAEEQLAIRRRALSSLGLPAGAPMPPISGPGAVISGVTGGPGAPPVIPPAAVATTSQMGQAMSYLSTQAQSAWQSLQGVGQAMYQMIPPTVSSALAMVGHTAAMAAIVGTIYGTIQALRDFIATGFEFNTLIERNQIGLTAFILTFKDLSNAQGPITGDAERYAAAQSLAADTTMMLRRAAFATVGTLEDLSKGFNKLYAAAGTTKATREEIVLLTQNVANLATALQIPFETAYRQVALLLQGVTRTQGQIGAFARELGISPGVARSWLAAADSVTHLNSKLEEFAKMGPRIQETYAGLKSQVMDVFQQLSGGVMEPVWAEMKRGMADFINMFVTFRQGELPVFREDAMDTAKVFGEGFRQAFIELESGAKFTFGLIGEILTGEEGNWLEGLKGFVEKATAVFAVLSKGVQGAMQYIAHPFDTQAGLWRGMFSGSLSVLADFMEDAKKATGDKGEHWLAKQLREIAVQAANSSKELKDLEKASDKIGSLKDVMVSSHAALAKYGAHPAGPDTAGSLSYAPVQAFGYSPLPAVTQNPLTDPLASMLKDLPNATQKIQEFDASALDPLRKTAMQLDVRLLELSGHIEDKLAAVFVKAKIKIDDMREAAEKMKISTENLAKGPAFRNAVDAMTGANIAKEQSAAEAEARKINLDYMKKLSSDAAQQYEKDQKEKERIQNEGLKGEQDYWKTLASISSTGADTRFAAIENAYIKGMEKIREDSLKNSADIQKQVEAGMFPDEDSLNAAVNRMVDIEKEASDKVTEVRRAGNARLLSAQKGDWATYEAELAKHYQATEYLTPYAAQRKAAKDAAEAQMAAAETGAQGTAAAWHYMTVTVKSEADSQRDYVIDSWKTMRAGFDDILFTGLSGRWSEFGNVFKSINDGMLKNLTKTLGDMAERWVSAQANMGKYKNDPDYVASRDPANASKGGVFGTGMTEGQATGTFFAAASAGAGLATGGAASFWGGMQGYLSVASALAQIPAIGAYAAAAVALAGVIVNVMSARQENVEYFKLMGNKNQRIGNTPGEQELFSMKDWVSSSLAQIFNAGASTSDARSLMTQLNTLIYDYVKDKWFSVTAGSDADFANDIKKLISGVFPQQLLHVLFGNPGGDRGADIAGIGGARQYDASVFDPNAPIPKFLEGLGFTAAKIKELSLTIDQVSDPKIWMEKLKGMVEVAVRFGDAMTNLGKNTSEVWGGVLQERGTSPGATFVDQADKLTLLAQQLNMYAGDEQIAKAKELAGLVEQYLQAQKVAITQLLDLAAGFVKTVDAQLLKMQDTGKGPDQLRRDAQTRVEGIFMGRDFNAGTLAGARTADQVTAIAQQGFADLQLIWGQLVSMSTQAATLKTSFADLAKQLSMSNAEIWDAAHKNPFRVISENIADMQDSLKYASTFEVGSQAWLDVMGKIKDQGVATFQAIADEIDKIHAAQVSMNADIEDQINAIRRSGLGNQAQLDKWNQEIDKLTTALAGTNLSAEERAWDTNRLSTLQGYTRGYDPKQQIDDLKNTIAENRAKLATAQTPEEIQRLQGLISRDTATYLGLFNNENQTPETQARAREWATEQLRATQREANAAFDAMNAVLTHARETLRDTITGIGPMMEEATTKLRDELWHVQMAFERLRNEVNAAYVAMAGSITDPNAGLQAALAGARTLITDAVNPALVGFTGAVNDAKTALGKFTSGLSNPTPGTNPVTTGGSGAAGQNFAMTPTRASMFGVARTIDWSRRDPNIFQPQQGVRV